MPEEANKTGRHYRGITPINKGPTEESQKTSRCLIVKYRYHSCSSIKDVGCQRSSTKGADYDGIASETEEGTPCLKWTEGYNGLWASQGDHNYCRNPSNNPNGVLCTTGPSSVGYCDVPFCPEVYTTRTFTCTDWVQNRAYWVWDHDVPAACESEYMT